MILSLWTDCKKGSTFKEESHTTSFKMLYDIALQSYTSILSCSLACGLLVICMGARMSLLVCNKSFANPYLVLRYFQPAFLSCHSQSMFSTFCTTISQSSLVSLLLFGVQCFLFSIAVFYKQKQKRGLTLKYANLKRRPHML
jgi:hypothetical protein